MRFVKWIFYTVALPFVMLYLLILLFWDWVTYLFVGYDQVP